MTKNTRSSRRPFSSGRFAFNAMAYPLVAVLAVLCLAPFLVILSSSLSSESYIVHHGYVAFPQEMTGSAYSTLFANVGDIFDAYSITSTVMVLGTIIGLFLMTMSAYVLQNPRFVWRRRFAFFFYFTTLFQGGLVPWYILCVRYLKFKQMPLVALIVPYLFNVFYMIILKTFIRTTIPEAITESAVIDGAGHFRIFLSLVLPLSKPALATIGLFLALAYWNDFFLSMVFINHDRFYMLQYYLYRMINMREAFTRLTAITNIPISELPKESMKMAMTIVASGPILLLYPFVQRYFVKGLTIGSVKG